MKREQMTRRNFLGISTTGLLMASLAPGESAGQTSPSWEKRLHIPDSSAIRILQFTDVHFFNGTGRWPQREEKQRLKTLDDMRRLIDHAKPDVLLVTGDLWHDNPDGRGAEFMVYAVEQCGGLGIPWAFTWGNHDQLDDYAMGHKALAEAKNTLYAGMESDGNYVLALEDGNGARLAEVFCLNTRATGVHDEARQFIGDAAAVLDERGNRVMRVAAFHIPVKQYEDVWDGGIARGVIGENVCMEQEDGASLPIARTAGIQAMFCGHDHVNDYSGVMDGVDMIYGRATGHNGYGADKVAKGAKLYTLDPARKALEWVSLLPDGTSWKPGAEERTDTRRRL